MEREIAVVEKTLPIDDKSIQHAQTKWEHHLAEATEKFWAPTRDSLVSVSFDGKRTVKARRRQRPVR